jgi:hypothetical protein
MPYRIGACAAGLLLSLPGAALAATTFSITNDVWPTDLATRMC